MSNNKKIILENIYFFMYLSGENFTDVHLETRPKEIQEKYDSNDVLSHENKLKIVDETLEYFYNFWKLVEMSGDKKQYIMHFNMNLIMINIPVSYYIKIKNTLESLRSVIETNLDKTYFKVENKLAKYFLDLILTFYKPIKSIIIL